MVNAPSIGGGIFLGVIGAILVFAVGDTQIAGINLTMIGYILLIAAAIMVVLGLVMGGSRRRATHHTETVQQGNQAPTVRETHTETD